MKKYVLVCPDCGSESFYRIGVNITLFNGIEPGFTDEDWEFKTTYYEERQVTDNSQCVLKCEDCEFEISINCKNNEEGIDRKLMKVAIDEGIAVEVSAI